MSGKKNLFYPLLFLLAASLLANGMLIVTLHNAYATKVNVNYVDPKQIGLTLQSDYQKNKEFPEIVVKWSWKKPPAQAINGNVQDIIAISWDDRKNWIGTSDLGEGGGGQGTYVVDQLMAKKGLTYVGQPQGKDGEVTFKLLPNPPKAHPSAPLNVTIFFIHPQQKLSGQWVDSVVQYVSPPKS
ncbi:hypothetical protein CEB3_c29000 [Peptococcaceae bacterium CEB3]|nr:hypothetical protein CEB3_c29000 [Peptococcaceae bacterium CEB3]